MLFLSQSLLCLQCSSGAVNPIFPVATFPTRGFLAPNGLLQDAFRRNNTTGFTGRLLTLMFPVLHLLVKRHTKTSLFDSQTNRQASSGCLLSLSNPKTTPEGLILAGCYGFTAKSRSRFKQSKISILISRIYVSGFLIFW